LLNKRPFIRFSSEVGLRFSKTIGGVYLKDYEVKALRAIRAKTYEFGPNPPIVPLATLEITEV
jgi:hypothetical protein